MIRTLIVINFVFFLFFSKIASQSLANMYIDWKFVELLSIVLTLAFIESDATLTEKQRRGKHQYRQQQSEQYETTTSAPEENVNNKCHIEVP